MRDKVIVGIYTRVSTQEQANEGYSISEQKMRLEKYAEAHNWIVFKWYNDPGFSGGKLERPGLKELIRDVKYKKLNKVLVYKLDRLSRSQKDTLYLIEDVFIKNDVDFISMTENFDTGTPLGRAMIGNNPFIYCLIKRKEGSTLNLSSRYCPFFYIVIPFAHTTLFHKYTGMFGFVVSDTHAIKNQI